LKFACELIPWYLHLVNKLTVKKYAKTVAEFLDWEVIETAKGFQVEEPILAGTMNT